MAGYSGTPLAKKLGFKSGQRALLVGAPTNYDRTLGPVPEDVRFLSRAAPDLDLIQVFCEDRSTLERRLPDLKRNLARDGALWVSWPKRASGIKTDLDGNVVREVGLGAGLVDVKVCAVDEVWSGLKFVYRAEDR